MAGPIVVVSLACVVIWLISGPALAQAPKKPPKPGAGSGTGKKPPKPAPRPPADEDRPKEERKDPYQHVPVDETLKKQTSAMKREVIRALVAGKYEGNQQETLQTYYKKVVLPSWTLEENYYQLPKFRADLRGELRQGKVGPPHTEAVEIISGGLSRLAGNGRFHPIVRYNAMLMVGDLNEQEAASFNAEPTPLPAAVPLMLNALLDEQLDAVKVAAMVGLARHTRLGFAEENQQLVNQRLIPALVKLAGEKTPPANRSPDGHDWMRCQAIDLLGLLRTPGPNGAVAKALGAIVSDKKDVPEKKDKEMTVRAAAARALGSLNYAGASGLDAVKFADALASLALDACARGTAGSGGGEDEEVPIARRRLRAELHAVSVGFNGIKVLAPEPPAKDIVEALSKKVEAAAAPFDKKDSKDPRQDLEDAELGKAIGQAATAIMESIQQRAAPEPPPAEEGGKKPADESKKPADDKASGDASKKPADEKAKPATGKN